MDIQLFIQNVADQFDDLNVELKNKAIAIVIAIAHYLFVS